MEGLNASVAYPIAKLDPTQDASFDEGEHRLALMRPALRMLSRAVPSLLDPASASSFGALLSAARTAEAGAKVLESILSPVTALKKPRVRLVSQSLRLLDPLEADELDDEDRMRCIAVVQSKQVALPVPSAERAPSQAVLAFAKELTGGAREARVNLERSGADGLVVSVIGASGLRKRVSGTGIAEVVLDRLFDPLAGGVVCSQPSKGVQEYAKGAVADFFERVLRVHVLCTAAAPEGVSRPLVVEKCYIRNFKERDACHLVVRVVLHQSSATCICGAHGLRLDGDSFVQVDLETCGRFLEPYHGKMRCPCHRESTNSDGNAKHSVDAICTERTAVKIACVHRQGSTFRRGLSIEDVTLLPEQRRELEVIMAGIAEFEGRTRDMFKDVKSKAADIASHADALSSKLGKRVRECHEVKSENTPCADEMVQRDVVAVDLLRQGGVQRFRARSGNVYMQRRDGKPLDDIERDLVHTHVHLFRKRC
jgi:hypothetical protein